MGLGKLALVSAAVVLGWALQADAQGYGATQADPCAPDHNIFGVYVSPSPARRQACLDLRRGQWDDYNARQKSEQDQRNAVAVAEREEQTRQEHLAVERRRAAYVAQIAAENSPDNHCRMPEIARSLMEGWNDFDRFKELNIRVVDIEHLTTTKFIPVTDELTCHGLFKTTRGVDMLGTISTKKNVAGDPIWSWHMDASQDLSIFVEPPPDMDPTSPPMASTNRQAGPPTSSAEGLAARQQWEAWLASLSGDEKDGATWWAGNRSSPHHLLCESAPNKDNATWETGCLNAQQRLTPIDMKRRSDPEYKRGWNSL